MFMKLEMWIDLGVFSVWLDFQENPHLKNKMAVIFNFRVCLAGVLARSVTTFHAVFDK